MAECFLYRRRAESRPRYMRVEITYDLFDDVAVICEWGVVGGNTHRQSKSYSNLRDASMAADCLREDAVRRGFKDTGEQHWIV